MRPTRLELTGFGSFRVPTVIDFTDADLFVLSGPTGAGKSTVIDAITFALYGSVARYDDRRLVAPVISQGRVEAKVRLDFAVDEQLYTAVRVVRRTQAGGATTKEARLERGGPPEPTVVAGNEKELTGAVEDLLGLTFEHFTRCVVLPQGAFAEFMHARPKERQDLLIRLLDLEVYRRLAAAARVRAQQLGAQATMVGDRLEREFADATPETLEAAERRVGALEELEQRITDAQPQLDAIREEGVELRAAAEQAAGRAHMVSEIRMPEDVTGLAERIRAAELAREEADAATRKAAADRDRAEDARAELPPAEVLHQVRALHAELTERDARLAKTEPALAQAREDHEQAERALARANESLASARQELEHAQRHDLARTLADGLTAGDDCPVCARPLEEVPELTPDARLDQARGTVEAATRVAEQAAAAVQAAATAVVRRESDHDSELRDRAQVAQRLKAATDQHALPASRDELDSLAERTAAADRQLQQLRESERASRKRRDEAIRAMERLESDRAKAWDAFDRARDRLAPLEPPAVPRTDLARAWQQLVGWAADRRPELRAEAERAQRAVEDAVRRWQRMHETLVEACRARDVAVGTEGPMAACVRALERARAARSRTADAIAAAEKLRAQQRELAQQEHLARDLGQQLGARRFEQWLLNRALRRLVVGASQQLRELSSGAYSLDVDDAGAFLVVDHRNADELRPARTLSGGETFLASLALALSLADHVSEFAAHGSARLDALFLDEGFGTLDGDTLEVVATALEELGAQGRMVGLVTHVRDLAERIQVRYEVRRGPDSSTVDRVLA